MIAVTDASRTVCGAHTTVDSVENSLDQSRSYRVRQAQLAQKLAQNLAPIFGAKSTFDPCANLNIRVRQWNISGSVNGIFFSNSSINIYIVSFVLILFLLFSLVYFDLLWSSSFHYR
jgi:hypothetical protein